MGAEHEPVQEPSAPAESAAARRVPEAPSALGGSAEHVLQLQAAAGNRAVARMVAGAGEPLEPKTAARLGHAFGADLSSVRVHAGPEARAAAREAGAVAFTSGEQIALGAEAPPRGTLLGDALIAHEVAHVVQQRSGAAGPLSHDERALERDASRAALGALHGGRVRPRLRSALRMQRFSSCFGSKADAGTTKPTDKEVTQAANALNTLFQDVVFNADTIKQKIAEGGPYAGHVLYRWLTKGVEGDPVATMQNIAGTEKGTQVVRAVIAALKEGDYAAFAQDVDPTGKDSENKLERSNALGLASSLEKMLAARDEPPAQASEQTTKDLARINAAIDADPEQKKVYVAAGLRFPVVPRQRGREREGGVYYEPALSESHAEERPVYDVKGKQTGTKTEYVSQTIQGTTEAKAYGSNTRFNNIYIVLGGKALVEGGATRTDDFVRSALRHEFEHFKQYRDLRDHAKDSDARVKALKDDLATGHSGSEVEAVTVQLAVDTPKLTDVEVKELLGYLAKNWNPADERFRTASIERLTGSGSALADAAQRARVIKLIKAMKLDQPTAKKDSRDLISLHAALAAVK